MVKLLKKPYKKNNTITCNLPIWMLENIDKRADNRSEYIREAIREYLNIMSPLYIDAVPGTKIITYAKIHLDFDYINEICFDKIELSRSELTRNAIRHRLLNEKIVNEEAEMEEYDHEKFVRVPGYNGDHLMRIIRRLD